MKEKEIKMKSLKKFTSFEEMKSYESQSVKDALSLKKHNEFEQVIVAIRAAKNHKTNEAKSRQ